MRNLDALNERLKNYDLPAHRASVSESHANLDWLKKHLPKRNDVDSETQRLLNLKPHLLHNIYEFNSE